MEKLKFFDENPKKFSESIHLIAVLPFLLKIFDRLRFWTLCHSSSILWQIRQFPAVSLDFRERGKCDRCEAWEVTKEFKRLYWMMPDKYGLFWTINVKWMSRGIPGDWLLWILHLQLCSNPAFWSYARGESYCVSADYLLQKAKIKDPSCIKKGLNCPLGGSSSGSKMDLSNHGRGGNSVVDFEGFKHTSALHWS